MTTPTTSAQYPSGPQTPNPAVAGVAEPHPEVFSGTSDDMRRHLIVVHRYAPTEMDEINLALAHNRQHTRRPVLERRGREIALTVGETVLLDRLWDEGQDVARLERALAAARARRELLIHKARRRGFSTREIGLIGSLTSTAVSLIHRKGFRRDGI